MLHQFQDNCHLKIRYHQRCIIYVESVLQAQPMEKVFSQIVVWNNIIREEYLNISLYIMYKYMRIKSCWYMVHRWNFSPVKCWQYCVRPILMPGFAQTGSLSLMEFTGLHFHDNRPYLWSSDGTIPPCCSCIYLSNLPVGGLPHLRKGDVNNLNKHISMQKVAQFRLNNRQEVYSIARILRIKSSTDDPK